MNRNESSNQPALIVGFVLSFLVVAGGGWIFYRMGLNEVQVVPPEHFGVTHTKGIFSTTHTVYDPGEHFFPDNMPLHVVPQSMEIPFKYRGELPRSWGQWIKLKTRWSKPQDGDAKSISVDGSITLQFSKDTLESLERRNPSKLLKVTLADSIQSSIKLAFSTETKDVDDELFQRELKQRLEEELGIKVDVNIKERLLSGTTAIRAANVEVPDFQSSQAKKAFVFSFVRLVSTLAAIVGLIFLIFFLAIVGPGFMFW